MNGSPTEFELPKGSAYKAGDYLAMLIVILDALSNPY